MNIHLTLGPLMALIAGMLADDAQVRDVVAYLNTR